MDSLVTVPGAIYPGHSLHHRLFHNNSGEQADFDRADYEPRSPTSNRHRSILDLLQTGSDDPDTNYSSHQSADGIRMRNGRGENGPTFSFVFDRTIPGRLLVRAEIGPSDRVYRELNLAMDFDSLVMASYEFSPVQGNSHEEGCANDYRWINRLAGSFSSIRSPCPLAPDGVLIGHVGIARQNRPGWLKVSGAGIAATVTPDYSRTAHLHSAGFTNHPYTHNIGIGFGTLSKGRLPESNSR